MRAPAQNAILRVQSGVCQLFRESLYSQDFIEIHTPKLIEGESESGAGVFTTDYFGKIACLAQSPQLFKQMAISSDLTRVFEIGPVFRAENSNTRRHLCEFTGLDIEMAINDHYMETLDVVHNMFKHIFTGLETRFAKGKAIGAPVNLLLAESILSFFIRLFDTLHRISCYPRAIFFRACGVY